MVNNNNVGKTMPETSHDWEWLRPPNWQNGLLEVGYTWVAEIQQI